MSTIKGKLKQKTGSTTSDILHPETEASIVEYSGTVGSTSVTTVKDALDEIISAGVGVTDVQNGSGTSLVTSGVATVSPSAIGAVAANTAITAQSGGKAKIKYDSKGLVTGYGSLEASDIPSLTLAKISDAGTAAAKGVATSITSSSTNDDLATAKAVYDAIDALPEPMVFKGTLGGSSATISTLPTAAGSNEGYAYKVIAAGTYASQSAKVGDVFISNGSAWVLIPSGDDIEDTWRAIQVNGTQLLGNGITTGAVNFKNGGNITVTGSSNNITMGVASGYSIPSTADQTAWSAKQDALDAQTAYTSKGTATKVPQISTNSLGQVTGITEVSITFPEISVGSSGSGNAITAIAVDSSNKHKINITKGSTFLTSHQDISGKADKASMTAGTYSAVTVNAQGIVTAGGQVLEVINNGATPSVATGGWYFEKDA